MDSYLLTLFNHLGIPYFSDDNVNDTSKSFLLKSFLCIYAVKFICFLLIFILRKMDLISVKNVGLTQWTHDSNSYVFAFQVLMLAPILEEILFRGILIGNSYLVPASISVLTFFCIKIFYNKTFYDVDDKFFYALTISLTTFIVLIATYQFTNITTAMLTLYSSNTYLRFLIVISALFFAYWHSSNFEFKNDLNISLILALLPHFISAIVYSGVCLKYGIGYSMLLHISVNLLPVMINVFEKKLSF